MTLAYHIMHNLSTKCDKWSMIKKLLLAVKWLHTTGISHRDLKPWNIMVEFVGSEANPIIIDFGMANSTEPWGATHGYVPQESATLKGPISFKRQC